MKEPYVSSCGWRNGGKICAMIPCAIKIFGKEEGKCKTDDFWTKATQMKNVIEIAFPDGR